MIGANPVVTALCLDMALLQAHGVPNIRTWDDVKESCSDNSVWEVQRQSVCNACPAVVAVRNEKLPLPAESADDMYDVLAPFSLGVTPGVVFDVDRLSAIAISIDHACQPTDWLPSNPANEKDLRTQADQAR